MIPAQPFLLHNTIQRYEWGTRNTDAFLPPFTGVGAEPDVPYAELWIGAHPKASSFLILDGEAVALTTFVNDNPIEVLGSAAAEKFSSHLPFLLKVLSAAQPLSIQAHPTKAQARILHARDPLNYPDENHKPEIAVALDELRALAGFKPFDAIAATVQHYPTLFAAAGTAAAASLIDAASNTPQALRTPVLGSRERRRTSLKEFYGALMTRMMSDPVLLAQTIDGLASQMRRESPTIESSLFLQIQRLYPADVGLLSILLLNIVRLRKGEGIYIGAGIPHAYLKGTIVECMANSDNVVRAGLTPKFKDVDTLCDILTYECGAPVILSPDPDKPIAVYAAPVPEFSLTGMTMKMSERLTRTGRTGLEIMLITEGAVTLAWSTGRGGFKRGDAVLLPASLPAYELRSETASELFSVSIP